MFDSRKTQRGGKGVIDARSYQTRPRGASGLAHIIEDHGGQFTQKGISEAEIPEVLTKVIQTRKVIRYQGKGPNPRPVYEFDYEGKILRLSIRIGSNSYIVGANFA